LSNKAEKADNEAAVLIKRYIRDTPNVPPCMGSAIIALPARLKSTHPESTMCNIASRPFIKSE
jgi:hypothetical protein